jgi:hypothetical protein
MSTPMEVVSAESAVSRGKLFEMLLKFGFFAAITVAMVGWVSAFGWVTIRLVTWLLG